MAPPNVYASFRSQQTQLVEILKKSQPPLEALGLFSTLETVRKLTDRLSSDHFRVMVLGEFKRGKSTFINALLGEEVLPAFVTPCTAVINELKWGQDKKAWLHFRDPLPEKLPDTIPATARAHIDEKAGTGPVPPLPIAVEELEHYVVIPDPARDQTESVAETPYSRVELFWPLELCRNGVEIIDSPGLNEHAVRNAITTDYLSVVDAIIFVMSCQALASQSEMAFIERNIRGNGHEEIFIICNRFDEIREGDRERVVNFAHQKLSPMTSFGKEGIYMLSALYALDGRLNSDRVLVERSGILPLESNLAAFLVHDRGRIKLLQPSRELIANLRRALQEIPRQRQMLDEDLASLEECYEEKKPLLDDAERRRGQILSRMELHQLRLRDDVRRAALAHVRNLVQGLPQWAEQYQPSVAVDFTKAFSGKGALAKQTESLAKEVIKYLSGRIEDVQAQWKKAELEPLIRNSFSQMSEDIKAPIDDFLGLIDRIKADLSGIEPQRVAGEEITPLERVLSAAGGFLIGGVGSAMVGGTLGSKEMLKSLVPNVALGLGMILLGITSPFILIPVLLGAGFLQGLYRADQLAKSTKRAVAEEMAAKLSGEADTVSEEMAAEAYSRTETIKQAVAEGLEKEIVAIREEVEAVLAEKRKGEASVQQRKVALTQVEQEIGRLESSLTDIVFALAEDAGRLRPSRLSAQEKARNGTRPI